MIVGVGVDLCEVERIESAVGKKHGEIFLQRVYTEAERAYCESKPNRCERLAGRFAAKEAAMKAIGTGWRRGVGWRDFEVAKLPTGQPVIRLSGRAAEIAQQMGVTLALVTITHTRQMAMAQVILQNDPLPK